MPVCEFGVMLPGRLVLVRWAAWTSAARAGYKRRVRVMLVGTDTDCGKTTVACALLRAARVAGLKVLPFKPAASGPAGPDADPERLLAAAALPGLTRELLCPLRFAEPVAPGLAEDGASDMSKWACLEGQPEPAALVGARTALEALEARHAPDLTLVEGAGGLWVPMPGGSWLPAWVSGLAAAPVVVGRLGLGTINHCLLTIRGLRQLGLPPLGFFLAQTQPGVEASHAHNERMIAAASGLECLGVLAYGADPEDTSWLRPGAWARLRSGR